MSRSLWMGDLEPYMDEAFLTYAYKQFTPHVTSVKVIRRRDNGLPAGYCFVEFASEEEAERMLKSINGKEIPGTKPTRRFRLNRAQGGKGWDIGPSFSIFVGDLDSHITDDKLEDFFLKVYPSVKGAKVMYDEGGVSRGYGFVRFSDETEQKRALIEKQNSLDLGSRPIRVSLATPKNKPGTATGQDTTTANYQQWWNQYNDYQYYTQYYNYYNSLQQPQSTYFEQQAQGYVAQQKFAEQVKHGDELIEPNKAIDVKAENKQFMQESTGFLDAVLGTHWQPLNSVTSKLPEM